MQSVTTIAEELHLMGQATEAEPRIRAKAIRLIELMIESIRSYRTERSVGLTISPAEGEKWLASVSCPMGHGRLMLSWGVHEDQLCGNLVAQREQYDRYDRKYWEPVWTVVVPQYKDAFVIRDEGQEAISFDFQYDEHLPFSSKKAVVSMAYAIVLGQGMSESNSTT